jgi:membrane protein
VERLRDLVARVGRWTLRHRPIRLVRGMVTGFIETDGMLYAAAIAYFTLLSLFQLAVLGVLVFGAFLGEVEARRLVVDQIVEFTPMTEVDAFEIVTAIRETHAGMGFFAVPLLIFGGLGLFFAVQRGVSRAFWSTPRANLLHEQLVNLGLMILVGLLLLVSLTVGVIVGLVQYGLERAAVPGALLIAQVVGLVVPFTLAFIAMLLIYRFIPAGPITVRAVWPAALIAAVAWTALQALLALFATRVADYADLFGPIASAVSLLVFVFASSIILLLGAGLAHARVVDATAATEARRSD